MGIAALCALARRYGVLSVVDNTFATPYNSRPLSLGADIVMHSVTKYLNGHSDVCLGVVIAKCPDIAAKLRRVQITLGAVPDAFACYLVLRSLKTLSLRME